MGPRSFKNTHTHPALRQPPCTAADLPTYLPTAVCTKLEATGYVGPPEPPTNGGAQRTARPHYNMLPEASAAVHPEADENASVIHVQMLVDYAAAVDAAAANRGTLETVASTEAAAREALVKEISRRPPLDACSPAGLAAFKRMHVAMMSSASHTPPTS